MMPTGQTPRRDVTGARIGAWFIDVLILGVVSIVLIVGMGGIETNTFSSSQRAADYCEQWEDQNFGSCSVDRDTDTDSRTFLRHTTTQVKWVPMFLVFGLNLILYPLVQGLTGATPGKALVGLRVVRRDGQVCGVGRSFLRHVLWVADSIICGLPVVGGAVMLSTQQKQRVGDLAASTFVVHRTEVGSPVPEPMWMPTAPPMAPGPYGVSGHPGYHPGSGASGWAPPPVPPAQSGPGATPGWGQAPGPAPSAPGPSEGPTWDAARGTYVQYDPAVGSWMQWNDTTKAWEPIS